MVYKIYASLRVDCLVRSPVALNSNLAQLIPNPSLIVTFVFVWWETLPKCQNCISFLSILLDFLRHHCLAKHKCYQLRYYAKLLSNFMGFLSLALKFWIQRWVVSHLLSRPAFLARTCMCGPIFYASRSQTCLWCLWMAYPTP